MKIILDENLPRQLAHALSAHEVITVQRANFDGKENGELLALLEGNFDVLITADKNLRYQQNLSGRTLAILEVPTNRLPLLREMFGQIVETVEVIKPGAYIQLTP